MKRYLINGVLTLMAGLLVISCHEKMETEYISNPVAVKTEAFEKAFKEAFTSNIDPNQDWGFGLTEKAYTRDDQTTETGDETDTTPNDPTGGSDLLNDKTLPGQQITTRTEYFKKRRLIQFGRVFCEDLGNNFASNSTVQFNRKDFDYNDVVFDAYFWREELWKKVTTVKTYKVELYKITQRYKDKIGEDGQVVMIPQTYSNGEYVYDNEGHIVQIPEQEEYDVLVLSKTTTENELVSEEYSRVTDPSELVYYYGSSTENGRQFFADIRLLACGATKPIKVGGSDALEVHSAFGGYALDCIINTFDQHSSDAGGFGYHEIVDPVTLPRMRIPNEYIKDGTINDIPIMIQDDNGSSINARELEAKQGGVPQKFMSTSKDNWTSERCFLGDAYPHFVDWAESRGVSYNIEKNGSHLYSAGYPDCDDNDADGALRFYDDNGNSIPTGAASSECLPIDKTAPDQTESDPSEPKRTMENGDPLPDDLEIVEDIEGNSSSVINNGNNGNNGDSSGGSGSGTGTTNPGYTIPANGIIMTYSGSIGDGYQNVIIIEKYKMPGIREGSKLIISGSGDGGYINININDGYIAGIQANEWTGSYTYTFGNNATEMVSREWNYNNGATKLTGLKISGNSLSNLSFKFEP